jgi:ATP-dependent protease ClpP protease subunit
MRDVYLSNARMSSGQLDTLLSNERYLNAEQCLRYGIVDSIY